MVGHTPQPGAIVPRFDDRVFLIDTAMAYPELNGGAVALEIRGDVFSSINEDGRTTLAGEGPGDTEEPAGEMPEPVLDSGGATLDVGGGNDARGGPEEVDGNGVSQVGPGGTNGHAVERGVEPLQGTHGQGEAPVELTEAVEVSDTHWLGQDGAPLPFADEAAVLEFLETAQVIDKRIIGKGVTQAELLLLEKDGIRARAAFHDIDKTQARHRSRSIGPIMNFRDSYLNNVAAYELGRLMGLDNMAPTTIRKVGRTRGSIQLWIEKAIDETQRREGGGEEAMSARLRRRIGDMWVFDSLIFNMDRNQGNMLHDSKGEFWMIDHTRSFNGSKRLLNKERMRRCSREMLAAIRSLDEDEARARLRPYLSNLEIKSLLARRQKLLEYLDERIASLGKDKFLFSYGDIDESSTVYYQDEDIPFTSEEL